MREDGTNPTAIGHRVRTARGLAGLTQRQLAEQAHVSLSLVKQVEQARVPASPAFVAAVARALRISTGRLLDRPMAARDRHEHRVHAAVPALRRELAQHRIPLDEGVRPRSVAELADAVAATADLRHRADLERLGLALPGLLAELRGAALSASEAEHEMVHRLLAEAWAAAGQVVYKLGYGDLSALTTERVQWAAGESGDALACAAADFYRAGELIAIGEWRAALDFLTGARDRIADRVTTGAEAALAMDGVLHLKSGLAAARLGSAELADGHLAEARRLAEHVTPGSDHYRLAFDRDSVNIWAVSLAVERSDGTEAIKRSAGLVLGPTAPRERVGHLWIDLARGYQLHGDRDRTLDALRRARAVSPDQTRFHPQVRETVVTLVEQQRRQSSGIVEFARWAGIAA